MKSSTGKKAHYRERHNMLNDLPPESTEHGFGSRFNKTSDENLRLQARQKPMRSVFSIVDGSEQTHDEILSGGRNNPRRKPRVRPSAATVSVSPPATTSHPLQVKIGPPVPTNKYPKVASSVPYPGMQHGPLSPSLNSDDTPDSATNPYPYRFHHPYSMDPGNVSGQQYDSRGVQGIGFPASVFPNDFNMTFDPELQGPLAEPAADLYQGGLMLRDYPPPHFYPFDGAALHEAAFYNQENNVLSVYSSGSPVDYPASQFAHPSGHIVSTTAHHAGGGSYTHGGDQYSYFTPNYDQ